MKIWVTKYALTRGIGEVEVERVRNGSVSVHGQGYDGWYDTDGLEWCSTKEAAVARAEVMRVKKIEALERQIERLKALKF